MLVGVLAISLGCVLASWVLCNLFVELQPEAQRLSPAPAVFLSVILILFGLNRATAGGWQEWILWRGRSFYGFAALGLIMFGFAYLYNVVIRLDYGSSTAITYLGVAADIWLLVLYGRILKLFSLRWLGSQGEA